MAWHFDETNDYVLINDNTALNLPTDDWTVAGLVKPVTGGSGFKYFMSWGTVDGHPSFTLYLYDSSHSTPGKTRAVTWSNRITPSEEGLDILTAQDIITFDTWQHYLVEWENGYGGRLFIDGVEVGNDTLSTSMDNVINVSGDFYVGARSDLNVDRYFGGDMAEWGKWDRLLSADEKQALVNRFAPGHFTNSLIWYCPMIRDYTEVVGGLTVTNNGSTIADHPPMIYPKSAIVPVPLQSTAFAVVVNDSLVYGGTGALNVGRAVVVNDSLVFDGTGTLNVGRAVVVNDTLVFDGTAGMSRTWTVVINDSLIFDGTGDIGRKWDAVINDALVFDGTGVVGRYWPVVVNDALVFDGTGSIARLWSAVINDTLVFDGTGTLNRINNVVVNDALVFDGTVILGRGSAVVINDSLVFGGSVTAALAKKWYDTGDDTALSLSWSNTVDDTATDPSWSDSPDDTATDPSWGDI